MVYGYGSRPLFVTMLLAINYIYFIRKAEASSGYLQTDFGPSSNFSPIRMRQKYTRVNILRCVFILRCANQPESKFKLRSHAFYRQEYFCR